MVKNQTDAPTFTPAPGEDIEQMTFRPTQTLISGGGATPPSKPSGFSADVEKTRQRALEAERIRSEARFNKISAENQARRNRTIAIQERKQQQTIEKGLEEASFGGQTLRSGEKEFFLSAGITPKPQEIIRDFSFKDISFRQTFFPTEGTRAKRGLVSEETPKGKILGQEFLDIKTAEITDPLSKQINEAILSVTPQRFQESTSGLLESRVSVSELGKFVAFEPLIATTPTVIKGLVGRGAVPVSETEFIATGKRAGKFTDVDIAIKTEVGGLNIEQLSKQTIKDIDDVSNIGIGKSITRQQQGKGKTRFGRTEFVGRGEKLGEARLIREAGDIRVSKEIGRGVAGESLTAETGLAIQRRGIRVGVPEFQTQLLKDVKISGKDIRIDLSKGEVTGLTRPLPSKKGESFAFAGTTTKPRTVLTKEGLVRRIPLDDFNVKGTINIQQATSESSLGKILIRGGQIKKTPFSKTFTDQVTKSAVAQVSNVNREVSKAVQQSLKLVRSPPKAIPRTRTTVGQIEPTTRQGVGGRFDVSLTGDPKFLDQTVSRFSNIGIPRTRFDVGLSERQATRQKTKVKTKTKTKTRQADISKIVPRVDIAQSTRQRSRFKFRQLLKTDQTTQTPKIPIPTIPTIRTPKLLLAFGGRRKRKLKPIRKRRIGKRDDLSRSETFIQRTFLKPLPEILARGRSRRKNKRK